MMIQKLPYNMLVRTVCRAMEPGSRMLPGFGEFRDTVSFPEYGGIAQGTAVLACCFPEAVPLAVTRAVNELYAAEAQPFGITASLLFPEEISEGEIRRLVSGLTLYCQREGLSCGLVNTGRSQSVRKSILTVNALGRTDKEDRESAEPRHHMNAPADYAPGREREGLEPTEAETRQWRRRKKMDGCTRPEPGDALIAVGSVGEAGASLLAGWAKDGLAERFSPEFLRGAISSWSRLSLRGVMEALRGEDVFVYPAQEGGIFAALWYLACGLACGFSIDLRSLPICQETVEICEYYRLNPYRLCSDGMAVVAARDKEQALACLEQAGIPAREIGTLTKGRDKLLYNREEVRCLDRPSPDELSRFLTSEIVKNP